MSKPEIPDLGDISYGHPAVDDLMMWFKYDHLPEHLQKASEPLAHIAHAMALEYGESGREAVAGLRKLLEAKDCFVRAAIVKKLLAEASGKDE